MVDGSGGWHWLVATAEPGDPYGFQLDGGRIVPDPASRGQAGGVDSLSLVPAREMYPWQDSGWEGRAWEEAVIYEVHIGTFTEEGTFHAASRRLKQLAELGITALEIMPVAESSGARGWGYDGVLQYAPHRRYGTPDDLKALVDEAHALGLMVILDVVYNHFGPEGNHLQSYTPEFFCKDSTPWGAAMDFRRPEVRSYFVENAKYWLTEFHLDGLRLDAVDQMKDDGAFHILEELSEAVRRVAGPSRYLITENPANSIELLSRSHSPLFDADWNDDFHHAMHVAATGETAGHYQPFSESPWRHVNKALAEGYVLPGRPLLRMPTPLAPPPPTAFVHYLQNHDQTGNRAFGERLISLIGEDTYSLWLQVLLLSPQIPLLFQGDDYGENRPFQFFVDTTEDRAKAIGVGRKREASNFGGFPPGKSMADMPDANDPLTFYRSKLGFPTKNSLWHKIRDLIALRHDRIVPLLKNLGRGTVPFENDGVIAVDWPLDEGVLQMRANFEDSVSKQPIRSGAPLHACNLQEWNYDSVLLAPHGFVLAFSPECSPL